jgi:hypothetical protein
MTLAGVIAQIKDRRAKRAHFLRLVGEINSLSHSEMLRHAYLEVYGERSA